MKLNLSQGYITMRRLPYAVVLLFCAVSILVNPLQITRSAGANDWPLWGYDVSNHRYNPNETAITPANVSTLALRWAFAFPDTMVASSQPTIVGDTVYVGGWNGNVYALDVGTGQTRWTFSTGDTGQRSAVRVAPIVVDDLVMFGDQNGRFFALNKANGTLARPPLDLDDHPLRQITGSPIAYGDRVYIPLASREESAAADPNYPCCTFRGGIVALDIHTGQVVWRFYTVDKPTPQGTNSAGISMSGPSGVGIWSTPAIDPDEGLIYVTTGNSYSPPASLYSDSILAINLKDGTLRWGTQLTQGDWANSACQPTPGPNCEGNNGNDLDFGSAPLLFSAQVSNRTRKLVTAVQKSGMMYTLDALTGEILWQKRVGESTAYAWGASYDGKRLYMADTSYSKDGGVFALDPATGQTSWHIDSMPCVPSPEQTPEDCWSGYMAAAVTTPGLLWLGSMDGEMRAFDAETGKVLWTYNTSQTVTSVNGVDAHGGSIGPTNATVAGGQVYVMSGYAKWNERIVGGNVLFVFGLKAN